MMFSTTTVFVAMLALAPMTTNAHMIMANPVPYSKATLNNSPLDPSGSDFPCKARPDAYTIGTMNNWTVGSSQQLSFSGTATHGGGSCQISVTTDKVPTKASKWKVIYSIEGGCPPSPGAGQNGNYPEQPDPLNAPLPGFPFTVPSELPSGEMSMAWTWYNKVGNREVYMNCAPVTISGGSGDKAAFDSLPDMAIANLKSAGTCGTSENFDYTFENPGKYTTRIGNGPFKGLCGDEASDSSAGAAASPQPPNKPGIPSQASAASQPANPGVPTPSQTTVSPSSGNNPTSTLRTVIIVTAPFGPKPTSASGTSTAASPKPAAPVPSQVPQGSPQTPAAPPTGKSCSPDGSIVCSTDGKQFAICNFGKAIFQSVASGTTCTGGKIAKRHDHATTLKTVHAKACTISS